MGCGPFSFSTSSYDALPAPSINPDPFKFSIIAARGIGSHIILKINYPDCKNYEGDKILVFKASSDELKKWKSIDPHFSDNKKYLSPIARFEPSPRGWEWATQFVKMLEGKL